VQAFPVENPLIWTKYVQIEFLAHYGNEFYCPLSLVRVHGTTMLEDYKHDEDSSKSEDRDDEGDQVGDVPEVTETGIVTPEATMDHSGEEKPTVTAQGEEDLTGETPNTDPGKQISRNALSAYPQYDSSNPLSSSHLAKSSPNANFGLFGLLQEQCLVNIL
jgi:Sad1 / UNC-like C-terminal